jgi:hypothetical protein
MTKATFTEQHSLFFNLLTIILLGLYVVICAVMNELTCTSPVIYVVTVVLGIVWGMLVMYRFFGRLPELGSANPDSTKSYLKRKFTRDFDVHFLVFFVTGLSFIVVLATLLYYVDPNIWSLFIQRAWYHILMISLFLLVFLVISCVVLFYLWQNGRYTGVRLTTLNPTAIDLKPIPQIDAESVKGGETTLEILQNAHGYTLFPNLVPKK